MVHIPILISKLKKKLKLDRRLTIFEVKKERKKEKKHIFLQLYYFSAYLFFTFLESIAFTPSNILCKIR